MTAGQLFSAGASAFAWRTKIAARPPSSALLRLASECVVDLLRPADRHRRPRWARSRDNRREHHGDHRHLHPHQQHGSFTGAVKTLSINAKTTIQPADKANDRALDYRIFQGAVEFGAAWKKTSGEGPEYLLVKLDDPSFPAPIYATLLEAEEPHTFNLIWSRRRSGD